MFLTDQHSLFAQTHLHYLHSLNWAMASDSISKTFNPAWVADTRGQQSLVTDIIRISRDFCTLTLQKHIGPAG